MISMNTKQEIIRRYHRENDSARKIARDLQINRKTVIRILQEYAAAVETSTHQGDTLAQQDYLSSPPVYNSTNRVKRRLNQEIVILIDEQIEDNERKKREGLRKLIKRKIDIHEYILSEGYQIGYTTVCNYIRSKQICSQQAYIRQVHIPGEECEFDWAEVKLVINGTLRRFYLAVFTSSYSNYRFAILFHRQDTLSFMEAHNEFFAHIQGVFQEMVYDNMRIAISNFVGKNEKIPTAALLNLSGWFHFRWRFCNAGRGNEKGHVERSVEYIRRKAFSHINTFDSDEHAQQHLIAILEKLNHRPGKTNGKSPWQLLQEEKPRLWKYPGAMQCFMTETLKADKYSTICYGTNRYSVPDHLVGRLLEVKAYSNQLLIYYNNTHVCSHQRNYGMHQWEINLDHYLVTLSRKPGALHGSLALDQAPEEIKSVYHQFFVNQPRGFIEVLQYCKTHEVAHKKLIETVNTLRELCPRDVSCEKVIALLGNQTSTFAKPITANGHDEIQDLSMQQLKEITQLVNNGTN